MAKSRVAKNPARPIKWEEAEALINGLFKHGKYRHAAYVKLSVCFGFRFSDTSRITWGDILDNKNSVFRTTETKTKKPASRTISTDLQGFISLCYEALRHPDKDQAILTSQMSGKIVSIQSMNMTAQKRWIDLYSISLDRNCFSQHSFRKASAMRVYESHGIVHAQNWLNHSNSKETAKYLLLEEAALLEITL